MTDLSELDREWAKTRLTDKCRIYSDAAGAPTFDEGLGRMVYAADTPYYDGPCLHGSMVTERRIVPGADPQLEADHLVKVPVTVTGISSGDTIVVYEVGVMGDPDVVDKRLIVKKVSLRSHAILRRVEAILRSETTP